MTKINAHVKVTHNLHGILQHDKYHVKVDSKGFPYVIFGNEKIILHILKPLYYTKWIWGYYPVKVEFIDGYDKFVEILLNPDLTSDKLSTKELVRLG